ncbi:MAG TPA: adenosylcobinamide-GDP ribazoletransferase [Herpetosiphonaceae bacterium]|nr:adenosylcobinamide-GDP ribazoletransferase [Herpetosiphonaceae bacterium]
MITTFYNRLAEALRFLTILPVPGKPAMSEIALVRAMGTFPLAGAVIGGLTAGAWWGATWLWGGLAGSLCAVLTWGALTSGLHLDGIADSGDALFSWRSRERKLEIMKDSRIGTMGALALIGVVLLKWAFAATLGPVAWRGLALAPIIGRWANLIGIFGFPPAAEGGLGRTFRDHTRRADFWWATATALLGAGLLAGWWGLLALGAAALGTLLAARWMVRSLGGLTGDTYGALCELAEVATLATLAAAAHHGAL